MHYFAIKTNNILFSRYTIFQACYNTPLSKVGNKTRTPKLLSTQNAYKNVSSPSLTQTCVGVRMRVYSISQAQMSRALSLARKDVGKIMDLGKTIYKMI